MEQNEAKQRRFSRYRTNLPLTVRDPWEREIEGRCEIISQGGLAAVLSEQVAIGTVMQLRLVLPICEAEIKVWVVVRNHCGLRHGVEFVSLTGAERLSILRYCNELAVRRQTNDTF